MFALQGEKGMCDWLQLLEHKMKYLEIQGEK